MAEPLREKDIDQCDAEPHKRLNSGWREGSGVLQMSAERPVFNSRVTNERRSMNPPEMPSAAPDSARPAIKWLPFLLALLAPPLLTILAAVSLDHKGGAAVAIAFLGSGVGGIVCGAMLGRRFGTTPQSRIGLGILFSIIM